MNVARTKAQSPAKLLEPGRPLTIAHVVDGAEGLVLADLARTVAAQPNAPATSLLVVCSDSARMAQLSRALAFFASDLGILEFPAWDCQPYDRASPHPGVVAQRMTTLSRLAHLKAHGGPQPRPAVLLTTVNAVAPARAGARAGRRPSAVGGAGQCVRRWTGIVRWLELNGFVRASTVREAGEYAVRGGIIDLFPPGMERTGPARFLRRHAGIDPHLRSGNPAQHGSAARARSGTGRANFSSPPTPSAAFVPATSRPSAPLLRDDMLYEAVSEGRRYPGMEHWLPLFHDRHGYAVRLSAGHARRDRAAGRRCRARAAGADRRLLRGAQGPRPGRRRSAPLQAAAAGTTLSRRSRMARPARQCAAGPRCRPSPRRKGRRCHRYRRACRPQFRAPNAPRPTPMCSRR